MNELIAAIYEISLDMNRAIKAGNDEEFVKLLDERNALMDKADQIKESQPGFEYTKKMKKMLEETLLIDKEIAPLLEERIGQSRNVLLHMSKNKQIMKNYQPYLKQMNGAFIDAKKWSVPILLNNLPNIVYV